MAMKQLRATRRKIKRDFTPHGEKWKHNMLVHFDKRLADLASQEPPKYVR